jgi:hypothetical protein
MERTTGVRKDIGLKTLQHSVDAAKSLGFQLDDAVLHRLVSEYQGGGHQDEQEAVASAILKTALVHRATVHLEEPERCSNYEAQYHLYVLVAATKGALDSLALWLKFRRKLLKMKNHQCDFTKDEFRKRVGASFPDSIRGQVEDWLKQVRDLSIWLEHRGTIPIIRTLDPVTGEHRSYELLVDRVNRTSCTNPDYGDNTENITIMASHWRKRVADFVSAGIRYGVERD